MKANKINNLKLVYKASTEAKTGSTIVCPGCLKQHVKTYYNTVFCKTKGKTVCKDKYWNTVTPTKRNNTTRISPASFAFLNSAQRIADREDILERELNDDGSWDSHQCFVERCKFCGYLNCRCED